MFDVNTNQLRASKCTCKSQKNHSSIFQGNGVALSLHRVNKQLDIIGSQRSFSILLNALLPFDACHGFSNFIMSSVNVYPLFTVEVFNSRKVRFQTLGFELTIFGHRGNNESYQELMRRFRRKTEVVSIGFTPSSFRFTSPSVLPKSRIPSPIRIGISVMTISSIKPSLRKDWTICPPST